MSHGGARLCHTSRSGRATDCPDSKRFPYYPSKQERSIFEYLFFHNRGSEASTSSTLAALVPALITAIRAGINVASVFYNFSHEAEHIGPDIWNHNDQHATWAIVTSAVVESSIMLVILCSMVYYMVRFSAVFHKSTWNSNVQNLSREQKERTVEGISHTIYCCKNLGEYLKLVPI